MNWQNYIIADSQILLGKPTIKGTSISVELILELFAAGWTEEQVLASYPSVTDRPLELYLHILRTVFNKNFISQFQHSNVMLSKRKFSQARYNHFA